MAATNPKSLRKKKFVDSHVQGALVRRVVLHWVAYIFIASTIAFVLQVMRDPFRPFAEHCSDMWITHGPFLLTMLFMLPAFVNDTIKISHRFTGPILRLQNYLRDMAAGESVGKLKFRNGDFWQGLASDFNAMVDRNKSEPAPTSLEPPVLEQPAFTEEAPV